MFWAEQKLNLFLVFFHFDLSALFISFIFKHPHLNDDKLLQYVSKTKTI